MLIGLGAVQSAAERATLVAYQQRSGKLPMSPHGHPDPNTLIKPTNRGDGAPDSWVRCDTGGCTADQLSNAVAVRLHVLARSEQAASDYRDTATYSLAGSTLGPFNDGYRRHVFVQTVRLHNVSSRRETPG